MNNRPYHSLEGHNWIKLILGASFQNLPAVEQLALVWSLVGVDCFDMCADPAVIQAVERGFARAQELAHGWGEAWLRPWVMVSLNDGDDPHFRKAYFPYAQCPPECPRPCVQICPAGAIGDAGVSPGLCYGCGRCAPVCPLGIIDFHAVTYPPEGVGTLLSQVPVDALEIHTQIGNGAGFRRLWAGLAPLIPRLKLVSVSFPDGPGLQTYLAEIAELLGASSLPTTAKSHIIWQTDGIPMSGDLGANSAKPSIRLAEKVLSWNLPGHVQLAGGTNQHSLSLARERALKIAGIAYGSYARQRVQEILSDLADPSIPEAELRRALSVARLLVHPLKPSKEITTYGKPTSVT